MTTHIREKYIKGELFSVGNIVLDKNSKSLHEVVSLGSNYLTVVDNTGEITKKWLTDVIDAESLREDFDELRRKRSSSNQIAFAGYKTKNFNKEVYESFHPLLKEGKKDKFQLLSLIRVTDELLSESTVNEDNYGKIKSLIERSSKYLSKMGKDLSLLEHATNLFDQVNMYELEEGLKVSSVDKQKAAKIIGAALGVDVSSGSPEDIVNRAAQKMKTGRYTPEAWKIAGNMFNMASSVGINWNKEIFAKPTLKAMGVK